jgi:glycosyltransferase involved in cell wall biosynthesis
MSNSVTIIIPAFNEEEFLPGCLGSIFELDYRKDKIEVIVVDNGSSDRTREIARSYDGVRVIRDDDKNVSGLRNLGAEVATGKILAFVDADCIVAKEWLIKAQKYFGKQDIAAWGSPPVIPENATWVQKAWYVVRQKENKIQAVDWLESMNLFVRKEKFLKTGGFDETLVTCEDVDFCYRMSEHGKIVSDQSLSVVHLGEASTINEFIKKEVWRGVGNLKGIKSHGFSLKELPSLSVPIYFGAFLPMVFILFIISLKPTWLAAGVLFYLLPSATVLLKNRRKEIESKNLLCLLLLLQIYFFARTVAVFKKG